MKLQDGFTLIELMITVVVVSILASIALPAYQDYVTRGKLTEAMTELSSMSVKLEQYYQDYRDYTNFPCAASSNAKYFAYDCPTLTTTAYTARATGVAGTPAAGFVYTIDQTGAKATTAPADWGGSATCWITKKGGAC